jgi:hypothetical protein
LAEFRVEVQKLEHYIIPPTNFISEARTCTLETNLRNQFADGTQQLERLLFKLIEEKKVFISFSE